MARFLRKSTAATIKMGPLVSPTDGYTSVTSATFTAKLSKAGAAFAARADATAIAHDADGYYAVVLGTGDTDTVGRLRVETPGASTYLPVLEDFVVLDTAVYDSLFGSVALSTYAGGAVASVTAGVNLATGAINAAAIAANAIVSGSFAAGTTIPRVTLADTVTTVNGLASGVITAASIAANAITAAKIATDAIGAAQIAADAVTEIQSGLATASQIPANFTTATFASAGVFATAALANAPTGGTAPTAAQIRTEIDANSTQLAAIKAKTDTLLTVPVGTVLGSPTPTTTAFTLSDASLNTAVNAYVNMDIVFTSGALADGFPRKITANAGSMALTVSPALPSAPASGVTVMILGYNAP